MCAHNSLGEREVEGPGREAGCLLFAWLRGNHSPHGQREGLCCPCFTGAVQMLQRQIYHMEEKEHKEGEFWMCIHPSEAQW